MSEFDDLLDRLVPGATATPPAAPEPPALPDGLGLEPRGLLARGGAGFVYRAHDPVLDRDVAVKIARPDGGAAAREALLREARLTARLAHPAVLAAYRVLTVDGLLCVEWQLAPALTLAGALADAAAREPEDWPLELRLGQLHQVTSAVSRAHSLEVVHGDLHPGNVALAEGGVPYVLDWGGAAAPQGRLAGDPAYAAPERLHGAPASTAADVYALGAIAWELCTLRPLRPRRPGELLGEYIERWRDVPAVPLASVAGVDPMICQTVERALAPDPAERPTAQAFEDALGAILSGRAEAARRRELATKLLDEARHALQTFREASRRVAEEKQVAVVLRTRVPGHAPLEQKRPAWEADQRAEALLTEVQDAWAEAAEIATAAATLVPDDTEARDLLAETWWERLRRAEQQNDPDSPVWRALSLERVRRYDTGRFARILASPAHLSLDAGVEGATAELARFVERDLRLVPEPVETVDMPLVRHAVPPGSWLVTVRAPGRAPARYPVLLERMDHHRGSVRLYRPEEVGEGWCQVPAGPFRMGGDPRARQPLDPCTPWVGDLFVQRTCVRTTDWLEFLDDLPMEEAQRRAPGELGLFGGFSTPWNHDDGWHPPPGWDPDYAIFAVDLDDAEAYATWLSEREGRTVRLPTEEEWEKAARGVDGRGYPWGNGFDPTFAHMRQSHPGAPTPWRVGEYPVDTSIYGVMDMAGGMREMTSSMFDEGQIVLRGGNFGDDADDMRCACRSGLQPQLRSTWVSFRLVTEAPRPA